MVLVATNGRYVQNRINNIIQSHVEIALLK